MYKKFESLSDEKQVRIINSTLQEFSKKHFKDASTDEIANNAGISKGALFQYFGTKKQLYRYVYNYATNALVKDFWAMLDLSNPDVLERLKDVFTAKMNLFGKYPHLFEFVVSAYVKEPDPALHEMAHHDPSLQKDKAYENLLANIDYSKFKKGMDPKQVISVIMWVMDGYANSQMDVLKQQGLNAALYENWQTELNQYINLLKAAFYEGEN